LVDIFTDDREKGNAMAFAVTYSYQTFSSQRRHYGQEAPLLQLFKSSLKNPTTSAIMSQLPNR
jgi:hypothetical protein